MSKDFRKKLKILSRKIRHPVETVIAYIYFYSFRLLNFDTASNLGSKLGRFLGPKLPHDKKARRNLRKAFPDKSDEEINKIVSGMWDNLGRVIGEFPHVPRLTGKKFSKRVTTKGEEFIAKAAKDGKGFVIFSGHLANWEIAPKAASERGYPLMLIYHPPANMGVDKLIRKSRSGSNIGLFDKGLSGARQALKHLQNKGFVGMLIDQKFNRGIPVKFFGRDAMTATGMAEFGLRLGVPLLPARVVRKNKTSFEVTVYPPISTEGKTTYEIMTEANILLEKWIREYPEQWFWVHKRWPN